MAVARTARSVNLARSLCLSAAGFSIVGVLLQIRYNSSRCDASCLWDAPDTLKSEVPTVATKKTLMTCDVNEFVAAMNPKREAKRQSSSTARPTKRHHRKTHYSL